MAASCCVKFTLALLFALLLVLTIILLLGILGLSTAGIIGAQLDDQEALAESDNGRDNDWFYYLIAATGLTIPFAMFGTATVVLFIMVIKDCRKKREPPEEHKGDDMELKDLSAHDINEGGHVHGDVIAIEQIKGVNFKEFKGAPLASITPAAVLGVFLSLILAMLALMCIIWGIAIAYDNARRVDKEVWPYITVEAIVGLLLPLLVVLAAMIFAIFLEYITQATVDARVLITRLFPIIKLVKGEKVQKGTGAVNEYWTIANRFYFKINLHDVHLRKDNSDKPSTCFSFCSRTPSTWILTIIVALSFLLTTSYFMNENITEQSTLQACPHESRIETDCFNQGDFSYINCSDPELANATNFTLLHCFKFLRFGQDSDVIGSLSRSFAFYLTTLAFFTSAFHVVNILINFQPSRLWGIGFVFLGILLFVAGLAVMFTNDLVALKLDVIKIFQVYMVAIFIVLVGLLLLLGRWWECVAADGNIKGIEEFGNIAHKGEAKKVKKELQDEVKEEAKAHHTTTTHV